MIKVKNRVKKASTITKLANNLLSHEHDFVLMNLDNNNYSFLNCLTCNAYFCSLCGRMLDDIMDSKSVRRCTHSKLTSLSILR